MIGVRVHPSFWLLAGLYGFSAGQGDPRKMLVWVVVIGLSILAHELGHALTTVAFGSGADIELHGFGGLTRPRRALDLAVWKSGIITLAGCFVGLLLAGLAYLLLRGHRSLFLLALLQINLYWSLLNLLPIQPLDGGRLLELVLTWAFGPWGKKAALTLSLLAAGAVALYFLRQGSRYNAAITALFAVSAYRQLRAALGRNPLDDDAGLQAEFDSALALKGQGKNEEASRAMIALRKKTGAGELYSAATEQLARWFYADKQKGAAHALLKSLGGRLSGGSRLIMQHLAYEAGELEESVALGRQLFLEDSDPQAAYLVSLACLKLADEPGALRWLKTAVRHGLPHAARRLQAPELAALRQHPEFQELEARARQDCD